MQADDISQPDGTNRSLDLAISPDGTAVDGRVYTIDARCGVAVRLRRGQHLSIVNPSGHQVCDFWAFADGNLHEYLSMAHLHTSLGSFFQSRRRARQQPAKTARDTCRRHVARRA